MKSQVFLKVSLNFSLDGDEQRLKELRKVVYMTLRLNVSVAGRLWLVCAPSILRSRYVQYGTVLFDPSKTLQDDIDLSKAQPVPFSTFTNQRSGEVLVNLNYNEISVVVIVNTGLASTDVAFSFSAYSKASGGE